jgi:CheY-like chemotaxis protein
LKLERLSKATVDRAVAIYIDLAYGSGGPRRMPDMSLPGSASWQEVLGLFQKEVVEGEGRPCVRYTLRLGNRNYPFMKLVLQEHLVPGEFFFAVDAHDEMDIKPDFPDYEGWVAVRRFNRKLKQDIEAQLAAEGMPTAAAIRDLVCGEPRASVQRATRQTILVVDDEEDLAETVETLLRARGFEVVTAHDGRRALDLACAVRPHLVLLDYELPEMDGLEVLAALKSAEATRSIPVLLTTASRISVEDVRKAEGFLAKPYDESLLYAMVQRLLPVEKT